MSSAKALEEHDEACAFCTIKYNRARPSFCHCKHCSTPLCVDCIKEHHDELLQRAAVISDQCNLVKQLVQSKEKMIDDVVEQSIRDVNSYFDEYIEELRQRQKHILADIEKAKKDAKECLSKMDTNLKTVAADIEKLTKTSVLRPTNFDNILESLKKLEEGVTLLEPKKSQELIKSSPDFSLNFNCPQVLIKEETATAKASEDSKEKPQTKLDNSIAKTVFRTLHKIDRMASDGENILYTSLGDANRPNLLCYCQINDSNTKTDEYRPWNQSQIVDIIWWSLIKRFICATYDHIYAIDQTKKQFKIHSIQQKKRSYVRVASNSEHLFIHENSTMTNGTALNQIEVYNKEFQLQQVIDVMHQKYLSTSSSFCVTDHLLASVHEKHTPHSHLLQLNFFDWGLKQKAWLNLGTCVQPVEIRTDGGNLFFVVSGKTSLHIISSDGEKKRRMQLKNSSHCLAVLDNRRVALASQDSQEIEVIQY